MRFDKHAVGGRPFTAHGNCEAKEARLVVLSGGVLSRQTETTRPILADFPSLTQDDFLACLAFAAGGDRAFDLIST